MDKGGGGLKFTILKKLEFQKQSFSFSITILFILFILFCRCCMLPCVSFITLSVVVEERGNNSKKWGGGNTRSGDEGWTVASRELKYVL